MEWYGIFICFYLSSNYCLNRWVQWPFLLIAKGFARLFGFVFLYTSLVETFQTEISVSNWSLGDEGLLL